MSNAKTVKSAVKSVSWTPAQIATLKSEYKGENDALSSIAKGLGKTIPMVRGKLVSEGLYEPNVKVSVTSKTGTRKISLVRAAEIFLSLKEGELDSLEKASKADLDRLNEALAALSVATEL